MTSRVEVNPLPWIAILVIALHATLILFLALFSFSPPLVTPKPRVVVHTLKLEKKKQRPVESPKQSPKPAVQEQPIEQSAVQEKTVESIIETPKPIEAVKPVIETPKQVVKKTKPTPAKPKVAKAKVKKPPPKKPPPPKEKPSLKQEKATANAEKNQAQKAKQQKLLAQAAESIGKIRAAGVKIDASQKGKAPVLQVPQLTLTPVAIDEVAGWSVGEVSYRDELAERLKLQLVLPEYGSVKLKLTLQRSGGVVKVAILSADSRRNREYVEKRVPSLQFPPFGNQFGQEPEHTFTITLNNDF